MPDFVSTEEIIQLARRRVHQGVWDYLVGGSESETTLRRNRLAFDRLAFRPRVLRDVSSIDTSTEFLGHKLRIPVMLAPVGSLQVFDPGGGAAATKAAAEFGIMHVLSSVTEPTLEETASCVDYPKMFQLYVHGDWKWIEDIIGRVVEADYKALCVTVDVQHYSRRERVMVERWVQPTRRAPRDPYFGAALTWDLVDRIRDLAGLPFMLKGIATVEDALIAVEHGVDVIWVSNHGGRQLDHGLGSLGRAAGDRRGRGRSGGRHHGRRRAARERRAEGGGARREGCRHRQAAGVGPLGRRVSGRSAHAGDHAGRDDQRDGTAGRHVDGPTRPGVRVQDGRHRHVAPRDELVGEHAVGADRVGGRRAAR